jgi:LysR family carnitine catabolism transcriptional activator
MNIKYRQLKAFTLAARSLSFTEAANALSVTQASFSSLVKELENDLDVLLFKRSTRRCTLTEEGKAFYDNLQGPLAQLELLYSQMKEMGQGKRGRLVMSALPSMASEFLPSVLASFRERFPNVDVVLTERKNEDVFTALKHREAELGLGCLLRPDPDLNWIPLYQDQLMLVVPQDHPLARQEHATWQELAAFPHIMIGTGSAERALMAHGLQAQYAFKVEHTATAVAMVRQGLGVTTLPSSVSASMNMAGVVQMPIDGPLSTRVLGVAFLKDVAVSRIASSFIQSLQDASADVESLPSVGYAGAQSVLMDV